MTLLKTLFYLLINLCSAESYESYEEIVQRLTQQESSYKPSYFLESSNSTDKIHLGMGMGTSFYSADEKISGINQNGIVFMLGMDLFNPKWIGEFLYRNSGIKELEGNNLTMREFEGRVFYRPWSYYRFQLKCGGGLGYRHLTFLNETKKITELVGSIGVDTYKGKNFSLGPEVNLKTGLSALNLQNSTLNLSLRLDAHF